MENLDELFEMLEFLQDENNQKLRIFNMLQTDKVILEIHKINDELKTIKRILEYTLDNQRNDLKYLNNKLENILKNQKNEIEILHNKLNKEK